MSQRRSQSRRTGMGRRLDEKTDYRHSRESTSAGQGQALWTFFIATALSIFLFFQLSHKKDQSDSSEASRIASDGLHGNQEEASNLQRPWSDSQGRSPNHLGNAPKTYKVVQ